jgi:predicted ABC-type transport system involved in lysophospholipase L1 biosynthesis ATPase subunit
VSALLGDDSLATVAGLRTREPARSRAISRRVQVLEPATTGMHAQRASAAIELTEVCLSDGPGPCLVRISGLTRRLSAGAIVNVVGGDSNGCAILLATMSGRMLPAAGTCRICGVDLAKLSLGARERQIAQTVATVLPGDGLMTRSRIIEGVALPLVARGVAPSSAIQRARAAMSSLGISMLCDSLPWELQPAHFRLALFARALAGSAPVLVCSHPEQSLGPEHAGLLRQAIHSAAKDQGRCVVLSSADRRFMSLADSAWWL